MSAILTLNAGSSSIKFGVYAVAGAEPRELLQGQVENLGPDAELEIEGGAERRIGPADHARAVAAILEAISPHLEGREVAAVGHRIVHGGPEFAAPEVLTASVSDKLRALIPLAPLHQPHNLAAVAAAQTAFPGAVQVGCFDTAFHRGRDFVNDAYALPRRYFEAGVRRYGFHGLSYDYITGVLRRDYPELALGRVIIAHLGNGASLYAVSGGRPVSSTMGFSALDGLAMGTRPGQLDPGVMLYLMDQGLDSAALTRLLYKESGLLGLSGESHDMRTLLASSRPEAAEALDYYVHRLRHEIGAMAADLGGLDGLVFTGGVGENAAPIRARVLNGLGFLGFALDPAANDGGGTDISSGAARALVIATDEERVIARAALAQLG